MTLFQALLNILFAVLAFLLIRLLMDSMGADHRVSTIIGVIIAIIVFFLNLAAALGIA